MRFSGNEIEGMILRAARGGGVPAGLAEDMAAAAAHLDLSALTTCPCTGDPAPVLAIPRAIDLTVAGQGPQSVLAEWALVDAYVKATEAALGVTLHWRWSDGEAVIEGADHARPAEYSPLGRRDLPDSLARHLADMVARTYVPETDASRSAGAGAGLTDND